jgi:hypothetical protein
VTKPKSHPSPLVVTNDAKQVPAGARNVGDPNRKFEDLDPPRAFNRIEIQVVKLGTVAVIPALRQPIANIFLRDSVPNHPRQANCGVLIHRLATLELLKKRTCRAVVRDRRWNPLLLFGFLPEEVAINLWAATERRSWFVRRSPRTLAGFSSKSFRGASRRTRAKAGLTSGSD